MSVDVSSLPTVDRGFDRVRGEMARAVPVVLVVALVCGLVSAFVTGIQRDRYGSSVTFVVQTNTGANDTETLIRTMMALIPSQVTGADLRQRARVQLQPKEITDNLDVSRPPGSAVITATYFDTDLTRSRAVAGQLVPVLAARLERLSATQGKTTEAASYTVLPWGDGRVSTVVVPPPVLRNTAVAVLLGLLLGLALAVTQARWRPLVHNGAEPALVGTDLVAGLPRRRLRASDSRADAVSRVLDVLQERAGAPGAPLWVLVIGPVTARRRTAFTESLASAVRSRHRGTVHVVDAPSPEQHDWSHLTRLRSTGEGSGADKPAEAAPPVRPWVVIAGPRVPGAKPVRGLLPIVDAVVVLAQASRSTVEDVRLAHALVADNPTTAVVTVLVDAPRFFVQAPRAAVLQTASHRAPVAQGPDEREAAPGAGTPAPGAQTPPAPGPETTPAPESEAATSAVPAPTATPLR